MVENRRDAVGAAAIALIHSNHIHARCNALCGKARHVLRFGRTFESMNDYDRQRRLAVCLPVAMTHGLHPRLDFDQTFFTGREFNAAGHKLVLLQLSLPSHCN